MSRERGCRLVDDVYPRFLSSCPAPGFSMTESDGDVGFLAGVTPDDSQKLALAARVIAACMVDLDQRIHPVELARRTGMPRVVVEQVLASDEFHTAMRGVLDRGFLGIVAQCMGNIQDLVPGLAGNLDANLKTIRTVSQAYEKISKNVDGHSRSAVLADQKAFLDSIQPAKYTLEKVQRDAVGSSERHRDGSSTESSEQD